MATAYTTSANVLNELHSDVPAAVQALFAAWIESDSRKADSYLTPYTTPLNAITAGTPTPAIVEEAVRYLVVDRAMRKQGLLRYDEAEPGRIADSYQRRGERILEKLRDGELIIPASQL